MRMNSIRKGQNIGLHPVLKSGRTVSFQSFVTSQKGKLKTAYPFLSADQINRKIKEKWKLLNQDERQNYTKTTVKVTPAKKSPVGHNKKMSPRRQSKHYMDVGNTPGYVNTHKLKDFRTQHAENYKNDHCGDAEYVSRNGSSSKDRKSERSWVNSSNPDTVTSTLTAYHWNSPADDDDDDDDGVLIQRVFDGTGNVIDAMNAYETESQESDEDPENDGVIIRRADVDCNNNVMEEIVVEQDELDQTEEGSTDINDVNCSENTGNSDVNVEIKKVNERAELRMHAETLNDAECNDDVHFKSPMGSGSKKRKGRHSAPAYMRTPDLLCSTVVVTPQVSSSSVYTTPQMDEVLQKLTIHEVNKAPQKHRHSHESVDRLEKAKAVVSGRRVTRSLLALRSSENGNESGDEIKDSSETNNKDMKCNYKKAGKLSLKNRRRGITDVNDDKIDGNEQMDETIKLNVKYKRKSNSNTVVKKENIKEFMQVSTNTIAQKDDMEEGDENTIQMNPSGDASQIDQYNCGNVDDVLTIDRQVNCSKGDSNRKLKRKLDVTKSVKNVKKMKSDTSALSESGQKSNVYRKDGFNTDGSLSSGSGSQLSSVQPGSSPTSSLRSCTSLGKSRTAETINPTLERVLRSLRATRVTSPTWSCSNSDASSPRLLSPALSGINELSSVSDQSSQDGMVGCADIVPGNHKETGEKGLCDMFQDVTPPECKTKGLYKTNRMLASGTRKSGALFQQLFQDGEEDIFS